VSDHKHPTIRAVSLLLGSREWNLVNVQRVAAWTEELENFQYEFAEQAVHLAADCRRLYH
jgi:hypothetical protein